MPSAPNIVAIPAAKPFMDVLAHRLLAEYAAVTEPFCRVLVLLPSRRACRSLREALLRASGGKPMLLPSIQPLGEVEEDEFFFADPALAREAAMLPPAVSVSQRRFVLARLIRLHYSSAIRIPSFPQSLLLADALGELIDEIYRDNASIEGLEALVPSDFAAHWQLTHAFLQKLTASWREYLNANGLSDRVQRQHRLIHMLTRHWQENPPAHPVIAAGSTGSMPAVRSLLGVIARMPQGRVVLNGLDDSADEKEWESLPPSHPQFMTAQLLQSLGVTRAQVGEMDDVSVQHSAPPERTVLLRETMRPAATLPAWQHVALNAQEAMHSLHSHTCQTPDEEAQLVALLLREALETQGKTAALVTRDRTLARRVVSRMQRYGVELDDSAGTPLASMPAACFLRLVADFAVSGAAPVALLSLLKHPYCRLAMPAAQIRSLTRRLETKALRGVRAASGIGGLHDYVMKHHGDDAPLQTLLQRLDQASAPMFALFARTHAPLDELIMAHVACAEQLAEADDEAGSQRLWSCREGDMLAGIVQESLEHAHEASGDETGKHDHGHIDPALYPDFFEHSLLGYRYRALHSLHPRLAILSPIEARLQHFDRVILGGMNEGSWPPEPQHSPWLNRAMRKAIGFADFEQRTGQSAHDFCQLALSREVFITRSAQGTESPLQPSRWLVRMDALLHKLQGRPLAGDRRYYHYLAHLRSPKSCEPLQPPAPCPPVALRPKHYSVSDIETLMRNPYRIYAHRVLGLRPLDDIDMLPDASHFGQILHEACDDFTERFPQALPDDVRDELLASGRRAFEPWWDQPVVRSYWWPRFCDMAAQLAEYELRKRPLVARVFGEVDAQLTLLVSGHDMVIRTRMDRVERLPDGAWNIVDYKTGTPPKNPEVASGVASQLPLGGLVLSNGEVPPEIAAFPRSDVRSLSYLKLAGAEQKSDEEVIKDPHARIAEAKVGVTALLEAFMRAEQPYYAVPIPEREKTSDDGYAHLIRRDEWEGSV